ncbi:tyrosine-protein phosphatase [Streptomyces coelicoflavus]|uniref:tyrosine-protein phosphatase n=1 Tax=Streptomyces coelicoflavus TaxID=285562 RepID=UPI0036AA95AA
MSSGRHELSLLGALNARDLGGLPTAAHRPTLFRRLIRSGSLQELTSCDVEHLTQDLNVRHVIDLRSTVEVRREGPGPLAHAAGVTLHHLSLLTESAQGQDRVDTERAMPWHRTGEDGRPKAAGTTGHYLRYCAERPDSVVAALRIIARGDGATMVHCAMGKDRTGVVCALALETVGVDRQAIVADYMRSGQQMAEVVERLRDNPSYAADIRARPFSSMLPKPAFMWSLLAAFDDRFGGVRQWLTDQGWTDGDQRSLSSSLIG